MIGISPHGSGLLFSDIYPGSILDSAITEKTGVLSWLTPEHELMADQGFTVQDYYSMKGVYLNQPAQKNLDKFSHGDVWPMQRLDLLSSTWKTLCHIVNLTMDPIGPNPEK